MKHKAHLSIILLDDFSCKITVYKLHEDKDNLWLEAMSTIVNKIEDIPKILGIISVTIKSLGFILVGDKFGIN